MEKLLIFSIYKSRIATVDSCFGSCHVGVSKRFSRSISLALHTFFWLMRSLVNPTLAAFIVCSPLQFLVSHLKIRCWWLKTKERKLSFRFIERIFLAAIILRCTGSAEGALVPVLLRITHWTKTGQEIDEERTARFTARLFTALITTYQR